MVPTEFAFVASHLKSDNVSVPFQVAGQNSDSLCLLLSGGRALAPVPLLARFEKPATLLALERPSTSLSLGTLIGTSCIGRSYLVCLFCSALSTSHASGRISY